MKKCSQIPLFYVINYLQYFVFFASIKFVNVCYIYGLLLCACANVKYIHSQIKSEIIIHVSMKINSKIESIVFKLQYYVNALNALEFYVSPPPFTKKINK